MKIKVFSILGLSSNFLLIILMFKTTKRTLERPRGADNIHFTAEGSMYEALENG
jgi:hypothetical protein